MKRANELPTPGVRGVLPVTDNYCTRCAGRLSHAAAPRRHFTRTALRRGREGRKVFFMEWAKTVGDS